MTTWILTKCGFIVEVRWSEAFKSGLEVITQLSNISLSSAIRSNVRFVTFPYCNYKCKDSSMVVEWLVQLYQNPKYPVGLAHTCKYECVWSFVSTYISPVTNRWLVHPAFTQYQLGKTPATPVLRSGNKAAEYEWMNMWKHLQLLF